MGKNVVFGFLGTRLDGGHEVTRWDRWRPTVALCGHESLGMDRLELFITDEGHSDLAERVAEDARERRPGLEVNIHHLAGVTDPWDFPEVYGALHDFVRQYEFAEGDNHFVHLTTGTHVAQICLFQLTQARYFPARLVETFSHGGEVTWKGRLEVIDLNLSKYDQLVQRFRIESDDSQALLKGGIATLNPAFNAAINRLEKAALRSIEPILLLGPTGAGKTKLAGRIHALRARRHMVTGPLVEVNCATLRPEDAVSTLFGHKKGAYTGATADRAGLLKQANKGILLLDEIGTLSLEVQAMLLCALEQKRYRPLGSDVDVESDFQLIAGTNCDLEQAVRDRTFRDDLLERLNMWTVRLPGLADRVEDIEPNLEFELARAAEKLGRRVWLSQTARRAYLEFAARYRWPGNFRELSKSVMRMATLADDGCIESADVLEETTQMLTGGDKPTGVSAPAAADMLLCQAVLQDTVSEHDIFELAQLEVVLRAISTTESMAQAGRLLFEVSRASKASLNDSSRISKLLARYSLNYTATRATLMALL